MDQWDKLWTACASEASSTPSCKQRLREHLLAHLLTPARHTLTSLITLFGRQHQDWTADYDLYAKNRVNPSAIFRHIRREVESVCTDSPILRVAIDDTILRKTGRKIPTAAYRKDPLGPPFHVNLVWAQRMIQFSAAIPGPDKDVRMIPIAFEEASTPRKPRKNASAEEWATYIELKKQRNLNQIALNTFNGIQMQRVAENPGQTPLTRLLVDGSYTNRHILRKLTKGCSLIGRIRKDAKLFAIPEKQAESGRRRIYGKTLPTPEQLRQDDSVPWIPVTARACGNDYVFEIKTIDRVRWRAAGKMDLRLVVIRPVAYRPRQGDRKLYRQPTYLICTDPDLPVATLLQEYLWRWDIEVNHRDEKTLLGVGEAQVRNKHSVASIPATAVAAYSMLHLAALRAFGWKAIPGVIPPPAWRDPQKKIRASTLDLMNELRRELWSSAIHPKHLNDFMNPDPLNAKSIKSEPDLCSALFLMTA